MTDKWKPRSRPKASRLAMASIGLVTLAFGQEVQADTASDHRCAKGPDVRRIEIRFADDEGSLPCKVIYRPEAESDTLGIVSWQDLQDVAACEAQAQEVIGRLTVEGWACAPDSPGEAVAELTDATGLDAAVVEAPEASVEDTAAVDRRDQDLSDNINESAQVVANPDLSPPSDDLASMIEEDLARLDVTLDGLLEATIAAYGDLNADDIDDALVLYTYRSPQPAYRQFLAAYVFDGDAYQLTATRPVSGNVSATMDARVEAVDGGVVHVALKAYEPGDASCCPSGTRHLALALRDLDLVEIDAEAPTR